MQYNATSNTLINNKVALWFNMHYIAIIKILYMQKGKKWGVKTSTLDLLRVEIYELVENHFKEKNRQWVKLDPDTITYLEDDSYTITLTLKPK